MKKPELTLQTTTLWEYPSQHYGSQIQGDQDYKGATPSHVIWNVLMRYTRPGDTVLDPMCGSGTTLDVCADLDRKGIGFDLVSLREDIICADARRLPLPDECVDFVFIDPPYSTHISYSDHPACIGKLDAAREEYYEAMALVFKEAYRVLRDRRYIGVYCCDSFKKGRPFCPIGFEFFGILRQLFRPVDIIAVVRHNRNLKRPHWRKKAIDGNYFLRGFNYLLLFKKEVVRCPSSPGKKSSREKGKQARRHLSTGQARDTNTRRDHQ